MLLSKICQQNFCLVNSSTIFHSVCYHPPPPPQLSGHPSREKSLSCKILQDSGRILQDDASSYKNFFQNLTRSYKINFFLTRILQDKLFLARSCKINFFCKNLVRSYKINFWPRLGQLTFTPPRRTCLFYIVMCCIATHKL